MGNGSKIDISSKKNTKANKHKKIFDTLFDIKNTVKYYIYTRMAIIKKMDGNKCRRECKEIRTFIHC